MEHKNSRPNKIKERKREQKILWETGGAKIR